MQFGLALTTSVNPETTAEGQANYALEIAALAEALGFESVWISDRTVIPADLAERYPDRFGPGKLSPAAQNLLEALTILTFVAARTQRVRLGSSVLVLPLRNPVVTTKMITTLDVLSGGRVVLGVGTGWMPEEFEASGAVLAQRGKVTDEWIELFKALCTQEAATYHGRHFSVSNTVLFPKPVQQPHPPVWVGGNTAASLRRAARLGDGWHGINLTPAQVRQSSADLRDLCNQAGRDPAELTLSLRATLALDQDRRTDDGERAPLSGSAEQVLDDLRGYEAAGLQSLVLSVIAPDTPSTLEGIHRLADIAARL